MSAVAHPATPEPRISSRSCGAPLLLDDEGVVEEEWLRRVVVEAEVCPSPPKEEEVDTQHLRSPTYELHRIPDPEEERAIIRWMVLLWCVAL